MQLAALLLAHRVTVQTLCECVDGQTLTEADVNWHWSGEQVTFVI